MAKLKFRNGISGTLEDWTNSCTQFSVGSVKRRIESRNPGEAGLIVYDKLSLTLGYESGNNPVYNNFSGDLSAVQKYIFEYHGVKSDKSESKLYEGLADLSTLEWPDLEKKVSFSVLDKLSSLSLISNSLSQRGTPVEVSTRVDPAAERITFFSGRGSGGTLPGHDWDAFGNCGDESIIMPFHDNGSYWGMPDVPQELIVKRGETIRDNAGDLYFVADSWIASIPSSLATSIGYSVAGNWVRLVKKQEAVNLIQGTTAAAIYPSTYYDKTEEFIDVIGSQDANGRYPVVAFNVINIIRCLIENVWGTITILNDSNDVFPISLDYYTQLIDENPFGMHSLDAVKMLAGSINSYIFFNKLGELVLRKKTNISTGTVRTFNLSAKKSGGKKKYFWDKLADAVTVTVKSGKTIGGITVQGSSTVKKVPGISPRNELKLEVVAPNNIETTESALNAYALTVATEVMDFYGKRHFYFNLSTRLLDGMLDWDLLDLIDLNGERYFILSSDINETTSSATFELVSVTGYDYDFQQARAILSTEKYNSTIISSPSSSSPVTTTTISITALQPLEMVGTEIKLNYEDNLKLSTANKLDTAQPIKITSTPQFARLGVGGAADAMILLKVFGDSKITGNLTVDGNLYIGGNINQVNVVDLDVADHAIRLNKDGDNTTALQGGIEMLGTSNALIGSIKYNGTAWLSDLNFDIATGKTYKINNVDVLSATALGTSVVSSSLTSIGTLNHDLNIANTKVYKINNAQVLSATALGTTVTGSSLTSVGTLTTGVWNATAINGQYINYNTTNLKVTTNQLNTIQDIATTSSPTFTNITLSGKIDQQGTTNSEFGSQSLLPKQNYYGNLGALNKKWLTLHAAELWVETLVAQDTIATIGGRILVGPTTTLVQDLTAAATTIYVKHNQMTVGDRIYMEADGKVEFMAITGGPYGTAGNYYYTVTRNLDAPGANDWYSGDAVFNTGQIGNGFIDLYSIRGIKSASQTGPTIVGNVRNSLTYNDWSEHWAIGNLNNLYGYTSNIYGVGLGKYANSSSFIVVDSTNGIRLRYKDSGGVITDKITLDMNGSASFSGSITAVSGYIGDSTSGWRIDSSNIWLGNATKNTAGNLILGNNVAANSNTWANGTTFGYLNTNAGGAVLRMATSNGIIQLFNNGKPYFGVNANSQWLVEIGSMNIFDGGADVYGIRLLNSLGVEVFRVDSGGLAKMGGWNFNATTLYGVNTSKYTGMQTPAALTTKCFFAGATDNVGANSRFYVQADGKIVSVDANGNILFDSDNIYADFKNIGRVFYSDTTQYSVTATAYTALKQGTIFLLPNETTIQLVFRGWISGITTATGYIRLRLERVNQAPDTNAVIGDYETAIYSDVVMFGNGETACFDYYHTIIKTPDGEKFLYEFQEGDKVISFNEEKRILELSEIEEIIISETDEYYLLDGTTRVTGEHPLFVNLNGGGWMKVKDIQPGMEVLDKNLQWKRFFAKKEIGKLKTATLRMKAGDNPSFIADGFIAHNKGVAQAFALFGVCKKNSGLTAGSLYRWTVEAYTNNASYAAKIDNIVLTAGRNAFSQTNQTTGF